MDASTKTEDKTIERLFDTAAGLFWKKSYAATTTREIAAALGIQQASLYHHMESKEDLLYKIFLSSLRQFLTELPPKVEEQSCPAERIRVLIHAHIASLLRHQNRNVTMLTELRSLSRRHRAEVITLRDEYERFVRSTLENALASGMIRADIPVKYLSLALLSYLNRSALWFRKDGELSVDQLAEILTKLYLQGVIAPALRNSAPAWDPSLELRKITGRARKTNGPETSATLERLLDAAVGLFSRKGYAATSTREVADLIGIQKPSLYYHIDSKEDLLYFICKASLEQIKADVQAALTDVQDPVERVRTLISAHLESILRDAPKHATTFAEMQALSEERLTEVLSLRHTYQDFVRTVLHEAQKAGVLRNDIDAKYLSLSLLGLMNRALVWYRRGGALSPSQVGHMLGAIFLTGTEVSTIEMRQPREVS